MSEAADCRLVMSSPYEAVSSSRRQTSSFGGIAGVPTVLLTLNDSPGNTTASTEAGVMLGSACAGMATGTNARAAAPASPARTRLMLVCFLSRPDVLVGTAQPSAGEAGPHAEPLSRLPQEVVL